MVLNTVRARYDPNGIKNSCFSHKITKNHPAADHQIPVCESLG